MNKWFLLIIISLLAVSCESIIDALTEDSDNCDDYDFSDCQSEPASGSLDIDLTINAQNPKVPLTVYYGVIDDSIVVARDTATSDSWKIEVGLNVYYSVTAKYKDGTKTIIALDGDKIEKTSSTICDSTCWEISGDEIDLRLKY